MAPNRRLLTLAGLIIALGAGIGLAILPQLLSPTVDDIGTLERRFGLPVLGAVSASRTAAERQHEQRQIRRVAVCAGLLLVAAAAMFLAGNAASRMLQQILA